MSVLLVFECVTRNRAPLLYFMRMMSRYRPPWLDICILIDGEVPGLDYYNLTVVSRDTPLDVSSYCTIHRYQDHLIGPMYPDEWWDRLEDPNLFVPYDHVMDNDGAPGSLHFYLMAYNEVHVIKRFCALNYVDVIYLVPRTEYFESNGFRLVSHPVPNTDFIGILTPRFEQKSGLSLRDICEHANRADFDILALYTIDVDLLHHAVRCHGLMFERLWRWLMGALDIEPIYWNPRCRPFFSNLWIARRSIFLEYIKVARRAMTLIDAAPPAIQALLWSDSQYGRMREPLRDGVWHYPFHPFLMERLIVVIASQRGWRVKHTPPSLL